MQQDSWSPAWIRGSKIEDIIWIGKEVLAWCSGVHIVFVNVASKKQNIYWCWNQETGEGARCLSAHNRLHVFAFAERIIQPKIIVLAYPSMAKVSDCSGGCRSGYVATAFTAGDHMISVGSYPDFPMIVWNWRTGDKIISVNTFIRDEVGQILKTTLTGPTVIAQMGKSCGRLFTWEMDVAEDVVILKDHEIELPKSLPILWVDWCPTSREPLLAITDIDGHIFLSNLDGSNIYRIVLSQRCGTCVEIELPMVSWFRDGIVLRTTFCQIRFFTRNVRTNSWRREWYVKSETRPYILVTHPLKKDRFFYYTLEGYLMQIDFSETDESPRITKFLENGDTYRFVDFIYPWCHHVITLSDTKELTVLECYEGTRVSSVDSEADGEIVCQASHPDFPLIALGTDQGELLFLSVIDPDEPKIVARLRLQRSRLDFVKFSYSGRTVVAAERSTGNCYCINLQRDDTYTVQCLIQVPRGLTDVLIFEGQKKLRVLVLFIGIKQHQTGQHLTLYEIPEDKNFVTDYIHVLNLYGIYRFLWHVPGSPMTLIGSPYLTRQLRVQKIQDFKSILLTDGMVTGHQVKLINLFVDRTWITTAAVDGLVLIRSKSVRQINANIMTHHRLDLGNVKAIANKSGDLIVCLGYNGSLVASKSNMADRKDQPTSASRKQQQQYYMFKVPHGLYEEYKRKIESDYASLDPTIHELLSRPKYEFPGPEFGDKTWSEWREEQQIKVEEEKCAEKKLDILKNFEVLRGKVKKLLDSNEVSAEIEKLPISSFDLDIKGRDHKIKVARDVCENLRLELEHSISEMDRVYGWIKKSFWDPQQIVGKCLYAILGKMNVTNYPSIKEDPFAAHYLQWANFYKQTEISIVENGSFEAWKVYTDEQLQVEVDKKLVVFKEGDRRINLLLEDEDERVITEDDVEQQRSVEGTTTHNYIEPSPYYTQLGYYGFSQVMADNRLLLHDCERLRAFFNRSFDEVYLSKEREMNVIQERIDRIRYIDSELRIMFDRHVPHVPADPTWHWQEKSETIIEVRDHEIKAKPYISPSQQELLDKQAAEEERIRRLLLADDFRDRALMAMMDGVLEVRWEDTIKIDVPKPACMLEKKPEDYNAEDLQTMKQYEKAVQFLQEERDRYKRMLDTEYTKVIGLLQEGIDKFNGRLNDLFHLKVNIEAAINQLQLRYLRGWLLIRRRIQSLRKEEKLKKEISENLKYETVLNIHLQTFRNVLQDLSTSYKSLSNKEKAISKRFKGEFSSLNKLNNELLERQSRRRPRTNLKNLEPSDFSVLAHHVITHSHSVYLPTVCREYLRNLDNVDVRPNTLPPTIENSHWDHLIRLRRQKIEVELLLKGKQAEMDELEGMIVGYEQKIEKCKSDGENTKKSVIDLRKDRVIDDLNAEIQLVLKRGQVEIPLAENVNDAENAILVSKNEIDAVNKLIGAAGKCKLEALSRLLSFQRGTLLKQWKHECEKKRLEDLEEDLRFTESVTVTKEMQFYLTRKARGLKDDKTPLQLQEGIEAMKRRFTDVVKGYQDRHLAIRKEVGIMRRKNEELDREILRMNVARCDMEQQRDLIGEKRQQEHAERKLQMIMHRAELIKKLQDNYAELLELQTEHELYRLKRFPTFYFKMLDDKDDQDVEINDESCVCK